MPEKAGKALAASFRGSGRRFFLSLLVLLLPFRASFSSFEASLYSFISAAVRHALDGGSFELDAGNTENLRQKALETGRLAAGKHIE